MTESQDGKDQSATEPEDELHQLAHARRMLDLEDDLIDPAEAETP